MLTTIASAEVGKPTAKLSCLVSFPEILSVSKAFVMSSFLKSFFFIDPANMLFFDYPTVDNLVKFHNIFYNFDFCFIKEINDISIKFT